MEITISEFEEVLDRRFKANKKDFEEILDRRLVNVATKDDLKTLEQNLKEYTDEQTDTLGAYIAETIALPLEDLKKDFKEHIEQPHQHLTFPARLR
jgi:hypothetical protein